MTRRHWLSILPTLVTAACRETTVYQEHLECIKPARRFLQCSLKQRHGIGSLPLEQINLGKAQLGNCQAAVQRICLQGPCIADALLPIARITGANMNKSRSCKIGTACSSNELKHRLFIGPSHRPDCTL